MADDFISENWLLVKEEVAAYWDDLPPEEVERSSGERTYLITLIQKHYGVPRDVAARQIVEFEQRLRSTK